MFSGVADASLLGWLGALECGTMTAVHAMRLFAVRCLGSW